MTLADVISELLQRLTAEKECVLGWEQVRHWPDGTVDFLVTVGLLKATHPAMEIECNGCVEQCLMPVEVRPTLAFVVCGDAAIGRIKIPLERLRQWQLSRDGLAKWLTGELGIKDKPELDKTTGVYTIGNFKGSKRIGRLALGFVDSVVLRIAGHELPLVEMLAVSVGTLSVDRAAVMNVVDMPPVVQKEPRYKPSDARREVRKLETAAMYKQWQSEYRKLKKANPGKSDSWIAGKIAKMEIAQGRDSETIRKNMVR